MARNADTALTDHFAGKVVYPILLAKAEFPSGDLNLWSGYGEITYDGDTYTGAGDLLQVSPAQETRDLQANAMDFTLSGVPGELISIALAEEYQDRPITAWIGGLDTSGNLITPYPYFKGRMDTMALDEGGDTATINLTAENVLVTLQRPKVRRYTNEDQQDLYPGDKGLSQVTSLNDGRSIVWGTN